MDALAHGCPLGTLQLCPKAGGNPLVEHMEFKAKEVASGGVGRCSQMALAKDTAQSF